MDFYILHVLLLAPMLPFIIVFICYHYTKHRSKQNKNGTLTIWKWKKNSGLKKNGIKDCTCYYLMT